MLLYPSVYVYVCKQAEASTRTRCPCLAKLQTEGAAVSCRLMPSCRQRHAQPCKGSLRIRVYTYFAPTANTGSPTPSSPVRARALRTQDAAAPAHVRSMPLPRMLSPSWACPCAWARLPAAAIRRAEEAVSFFSDSAPTFSNGAVSSSSSKPLVWAVAAFRQRQPAPQEANSSFLGRQPVTVATDPALTARTECRRSASKPRHLLHVPDNRRVSQRHGLQRSPPFPGPREP